MTELSSVNNTNNYRYLKVESLKNVETENTQSDLDEQQTPFSAESRKSSISQSDMFSRLKNRNALPETPQNSSEEDDTSLNERVSLYRSSESSDDSMSSSKDFCKEIEETIADINDDYLKIYEDVLALYVEFYQELSDIISELGSLISDADDNKVKVDSKRLNTLLNTLKTKYQNKQLYPVDSSKSATRAEADDWANKLGLPSSCVVADGKGGYKVMMDLSPINKMISDLSALKDKDGNDAQLSSAKYQAWKAGFDAQVEKINNQVQTLSQKYTTANSTFDNLVKVLSSTITAMYDADKEFLKN